MKNPTENPPYPCDWFIHRVKFVKIKAFGSMGTIRVYQVWTERNKQHSAWGDVFYEFCRPEAASSVASASGLYIRISHQIVQMCLSPSCAPAGGGVVCMRTDVLGEPSSATL